MAEKWTPGPWEFRPHVAAHRGNIISVCKGFPQRWVADAIGQETADERKANAYLIAAAPDMHAALTEAEACMSIVEPRSDKAEYLRILGVVRTALAKANGV